MNSIAAARRRRTEPQQPPPGMVVFGAGNQQIQQAPRGSYAPPPAVSAQQQQQQQMRAAMAAAASQRSAGGRLSSSAPPAPPQTSPVGTQMTLQGIISLTDRRLTALEKSLKTIAQDQSAIKTLCDDMAAGIMDQASAAAEFAPLQTSNETASTEKAGEADELQQQLREDLQILRDEVDKLRSFTMDVVRAMWLERQAAPAGAGVVATANEAAHAIASVVATINADRGNDDLQTTDHFTSLPARDPQNLQLRRPEATDEADAGCADESIVFNVDEATAAAVSESSSTESSFLSDVFRDTVFTIGDFADDRATNESAVN